MTVEQHDGLVRRGLFVIAAVAAVLPWVPAPAALVGGLVFALGWGNPFAAQTTKLTPVVLQISVVGLGAAMNLQTVALAGLRGFVATLVGITATLVLGQLLARLFKTEPTTGLLIGVGTAICGGSAIAAVAPVVRAKPEQTSVALAVVFLLNAAALLIFPRVGHAFSLTQDQFGLWAALAIHDTSSVVAAGAEYGARALELATTVKLARALWIVPVALAMGRLWKPAGETAPAGPVKKPWFILGFLIAAALATFVPGLQGAGAIVGQVARRTLVLSLFLIGAGITREALKQVGARALGLGVVLWLLVATASLGAIVFLTSTP